jgi:hypothetical protein
MEKEDLLVWTQIVTAVLLLISEGLGWSQCRSNSVTQLIIGSCRGYRYSITREKVDINNDTAPIIVANEELVRTGTTSSVEKQRQEDQGVNLAKVLPSEGTG